jgi:hypothetical protein
MLDEQAEVTHFDEEEQEELAPYRPLSGLALLGLLLGLVSVFAYWQPALVVIPAVGAVVSGMALRRMSSDPQALSGRWLALAGLALAVGCGSAGIARFASYQWQFEREARTAVELWFEYLANAEPHKAHQLTKTPAERLPLDDKLWRAYRNNNDLQAGIRDYVRQQPVRTLLALGRTAQVRFYQTEAASGNMADAETAEVYAVTYPDAGRTKTFFVHVTVRRLQRGRADAPGWVIGHARGGYRPIGWGDAP